MTLTQRQPFAAIDMPRLQSLSNIKNRQNAISPFASSPMKNAASAGKRSLAATSFDADDAENVDPSVFNSPTKRSKTTKMDDGMSKEPKYHLSLTPPAQKTFQFSSPPVPSVRKALSSPAPAIPTSISTSRGSPKHKRVGLLSKRRVSSSPFKRIDPPSFGRNSSPALPFSIDAALSGTIPTYTPKPAVAAPAPAPAPAQVQTLEESMPKSWFFEIHEDTPEQEATNLMEHSACVLDISSDDDNETRRKNEELERGKENIPPPDHATFRIHSNDFASRDGRLGDEAQREPSEPTKHPRLRNIAQDAMDEDRSPLSDLPAAEFYGPGLDASSYATVDVAIENPSSLSKEFDFNLPADSKEPNEEKLKDEASPPLEPIGIYADETSTQDLPVDTAAPELPAEAAPEDIAAPELPAETSVPEPVVETIADELPIETVTEQIPNKFGDAMEVTVEALPEPVPA